MKTLTNPDGKTFKLGRKRPVARGPRLKLRNYLMRSLPTPSDSCDYSSAASSQLSNIYLNDALGDCVIACMGHVDAVLTANAGRSTVTYTSDQITSLYSAIGGYVPGDPSTDNGCDEQTALNYWQQNGAMPTAGPDGDKSHRIAGWLAINGADPVEVRTAIYLFENLVFGIELPDAWITPFPSSNGFTWDIAGAADPSNGHCVCAVGYTSAGPLIDTWGMLGTMTDAAVAQYTASSDGGELYSVVSLEALNAITGNSPAGVDWSQLVADFDSILPTA